MNFLGVQPQQTAPTQQLEKLTFEKLPEQVQAAMRSLEKHMFEERNIGDKLSSEENMMKTRLGEIKNKAQSQARLLSTIDHNMKRSIEKVEELKPEVAEEKKYGEQAASNWNKIRNSRPLEKDYTSIYFQRVSEKLEKQMYELWRQIEDVATTLSRSEQSTISSAAMLQDALKAQQETFLNIATNVAALHESADEVREMYRKLFKEDPFSEGNGAKASTFQLPSGPMTLPGIMLQQPQQQQPQQQQQQQTQQQFSFGPPAVQQQQPQQQQQQSSFSFGAPAVASTTPQYNFGFGAPAQQQTQAATSQFSFDFGAPSTTTSTGNRPNLSINTNLGKRDSAFQI
jgi:hypothetical protein